MAYRVSWPSIKLQDKLASVVLSKKAALIVESDTDRRLYASVLSKCGVDWSEIDLVLGEEKSRIIAFVRQGSAPFPFAAIVDRDHDEIEGKLVSDSRLFYTHYYSVESYLVLQRVVRELLELWAEPGEDVEATLNDVLVDVFRLLEPVGAAVLLKARRHWPIPLETNGVEMWLDGAKMSVDQEGLIEHLWRQLRSHGHGLNRDALAKEHGRVLAEWQGLRREEQLQYLPGKWVLSALFWTVRRAKADRMDARQLRAFSQDLAVHMHVSVEAQELMKWVSDRCSGLAGGIARLSRHSGAAASAHGQGVTA